MRRIHDALTLAQELAHPFSLAFAAWLHQLRREGPATHERAAALMALATEQGFPFWEAWGTILQGWALAAQGQSAEGIAQMRQGIVARGLVSHAPRLARYPPAASTHCTSTRREAMGVERVYPW